MWSLIHLNLNLNLQILNNGATWLTSELYPGCRVGGLIL